MDKNMQLAGCNTHARANKQWDVTRGDISTSVLPTRFVTGLTSSWGTGGVLMHCFLYTKPSLILIRRWLALERHFRRGKTSY